MISAVLTTPRALPVVKPAPYADLDLPAVAPMAIDTPQGNYHDSLIYNFKDVNYESPLYTSQGGLRLSQASNIKTEVTYNPQTSKYLVTQMMGDKMYRPPVEMDEEEYRDWIFKQGVKKYWKSRIEADNVNQNKPLIPKLTVSGEW